MEQLLSLWFPIVVSSVVLFVAGFLSWMVLPHHRSDWSKLEKEKEFLESITTLGLKPGHYLFPYFSNPEEMKSVEYKMRWEKGPRGMLSIWGGPPDMGRNMALTFCYDLVVGVFVAYLASLTLEPGAGFTEVFRITGTAAVMAHTFGGIPHAIWFKRKFGAIVNDVLDGIAYGLLTGLVFGWMWPAAAVVAG